MVSGGNGQRPPDDLPSVVGKDKVKRRRDILAARISQDPDSTFTVNELAAEFKVSRRTIQRDLEAPEVMAAYDQTIEEFIDVYLMQAAWKNVRREIIEKENTERSIWLIEHRAKTAHQERMWEAFQSRLAKAMVDTYDLPVSEIDYNERVTIEIMAPNSTSY